MDVFPEGNNPFLQRLIYEGVQKAVAEAPGVSYESIVVVNRTCLYITPIDASSTMSNCLRMVVVGFSIFQMKWFLVPRLVR